MTFENPFWLLLLALIPGLIFLRLSQRPQGIPLSTLRLLDAEVERRPRWVRKALWALRLGTFVLLILALARPQGAGRWVEDKRYGIDLMLALDLSGSMRAEDFQPANRLEAAKRVLAEFVAKNTENRIGLVGFAGHSLTLCPLTTDTAMVASLIERIGFDSVGQDGTAIGEGIGNCLYRLEDQHAKSRVIVLFSDGENNSGYLSPLDAAAMAKARGIKIYTIAVGRPGGAPIPFLDSFGRKTYVRNRDGSLFLPPMDEGTLHRIADVTGGRYFRATDTSSMAAAYAEIAKLERSEIPINRHRVPTDLFMAWLGAALVLFGAELTFSSRWGTILRGRHV